MFKRLLAATAALFVFTAPSFAAPVTISGDGELGSFTGFFDFRPEDSKLSISLTNTSAPSSGGYITGFVFNFDSPFSLSLDTSTAGAFQLVTSEPADPFGTFDYGAALGGEFLGGGKPQDGIAVGDTRTFNFTLFIPEQSVFPAGFDSIGALGDGDFLVRFRGFEDGGSDKVPGSITPATVPTPAAAWAGISIFLCLAGFKLYRRHFDLSRAM
jgi:hypothetical protein